MRWCHCYELEIHRSATVGRCALLTQATDFLHSNDRRSLNVDRDWTMKTRVKPLRDKSSQTSERAHRTCYRLVQSTPFTDVFISRMALNRQTWQEHQRNGVREDMGVARNGRYIVCKHLYL